MITDRELLELAAKAAGVSVEWKTWVVSPKAIAGCCHRYKDKHEYWSPLYDDGDEARLEAALMLDVLWWIDYVEVCNRDASARAFEAFSDHNGDRQAARRAAGVRCAAEIGRKM